MTYRKRTTAIQVRVTEQEKRKLERQAKRCGLSLSGYLRRVGTGEPVAAFHSQRFHELYRQVNGLRDDPTTQPMERTMATTKIWPAKDSLARVVDYAQNPEKTTYLDLRNVLHYAANEEKTVERTERAMFVTGVNCNRDTAFQEMQAVKERFGLQEKKALTAKRRNWTRPNSG